MLIKICGLTHLDDARQALDQGADYLGFVLYSKSPRHVTVAQLAALAERLPEPARLVGVFVNMPPPQVVEVAVRCRLAAVQIHGDEEAEGFAGLAVPVWRAVRLRRQCWMPDPAGWSPERYVMDAFSPAYGGTGLTVDWEEAARFAARYRAMLAGGLDAANVGEAVRRVRPLGLDVSSGVEAEPGRKDHRKVAAFIRAARAAGSDLG